MNNQQRTLEIEKLAHQNNWSFWAAPEISLVPAMQKFEFHTGETQKMKKIENLISDNGFKAFDVFWQKGFDPADAMAIISHKDSSVRRIHQQTIFYYESADLHLPKFHVYPLSSFSFVDRWLDRNFRQIRFTNNPSFEKNWSVRGIKQQEIVKYFTDSLIDFYESSQSFWTFAIDNCIFIYQPNILTPPDQFESWSGKITELQNLLKGN